MEKMALVTAGIIFLIISILHLLRVLFKIEVRIGNHITPVWFSLLGFLFPLLLSLWMFNLVKSEPNLIKTIQQLMLKPIVWQSLAGIIGLAALFLTYKQIVLSKGKRRKRD